MAAISISIVVAAEKYAVAQAGVSRALRRILVSTFSSVATCTIAMSRRLAEAVVRGLRPPLCPGLCNARLQHRFASLRPCLFRLVLIRIHAALGAAPHAGFCTIGQRVALTACEVFLVQRIESAAPNLGVASPKVRNWL